MLPLKLDEDIRPLSEFRAGVASFVKQVNETGRPLVLTQRGRGVAVVLDIRAFEAMRERLALLEDITRAEAQLAAGEGVSHEEAKAHILKRIDACRQSGLDPALERVDEIAVYIAQDDLAAAARWIEELFDAYRVFYRVGSAVEVLSVRHGSQLIHSGEVGGD